MSRAAHGRPGPGRPPSRRRTATFVILQANYQYGDRGCHHDHAPFRFLIVNAGVQVDAFDHNDSEGGWTQIFAFKLLCWCIIAFGARKRIDVTPGPASGPGPWPEKLSRIQVIMIA